MCARLPLLGNLLIYLLAGVCWGAGPKELLTTRPALDWQAAASSIVITPTKNLWMAGYAARKKPAEGKAQDLFAKAIALQDQQGQTLVMVTMDLIGVPQTLRDRVSKRATESLGIPTEFLLMNASHTHSGPSLQPGPLNDDPKANPMSADNYQYTQELEARLFDLIKDTVAKLEPARLSWSRARCGFAMNRRRPTAKGYINSPYPDGPVDHEVPVLRIEAADGSLRAMLFGYCCHNTCLGFYNYCGDYAGFAQEYLQEHRQNFVASFLMGCSGDQNPYPRGNNVVPGMSDLDLAKQHGRSLANAAEMSNLVPQRAVDGPLRAAYGHVMLDYADLKKTAHAYPVQVVRFGNDLTLVALGSETVVDYSLRLKKELAGDAAVWIAGYSNDYNGYIPSLRVQKEGGYEANAGWADSTEERIIAKVHELCAKASRD